MCAHYLLECTKMPSDNLNLYSMMQDHGFPDILLKLKIFLLFIICNKFFRPRLIPFEFIPQGAQW